MLSRHRLAALLLALPLLLSLAFDGPPGPGGHDCPPDEIICVPILCPGPFPGDLGPGGPPGPGGIPGICLPLGVPPTISAEDQELEATSLDGVAFDPHSVLVVTDPDGLLLEVGCSVPGALFPIGTTEVACSAISFVGVATTVFDVTVVDAAPVLSLPTPTPVEATGPDGAAVLYDAPTATDTIAGDVPVDCDAASGDTFPLGETVVTCSATDLPGEVAVPTVQSLPVGNVTTDTFVVTVVDTTPPTVTVPADLELEATGPTGAVATFDAPTAADLVAGDVPVDCDAASGDTFPLGTTTVTCTATDLVRDIRTAELTVEPVTGNVATATFDVTVVDTTGPSLTLPSPDPVEATGPGGAPVTFPTPTATDTVAGDVPVSCDAASGDTFPVGTTVVTCQATDLRVALAGGGPAGNVTTSTFGVVVQDTTAPVLRLPSEAVVPATSLDGAAFTYASSASDVVDGATDVVCDHASGATFPLGTTTVTCTSTDAAGNIGTAGFDVQVTGDRSVLGAGDANADDEPAAAPLPVADQPAAAPLPAAGSDASSVALIALLLLVVGASLVMFPLRRRD